MRSRRKIDILDVHQTIWRCRDFELTYLWQRSIFLTAFLVLCYTGYGFLLLESIKTFFDNSNVNGVNISSFINLFILFLSCIGIIFSTLWIKMAKGSKAWYERYESAISVIEQDKSFIRKRAMPIAAFQYTELIKERPPIDSSLFSMNAGPYSPSKINIAIGQISLIIWMLIGVFHLLWQFVCFSFLIIKINKVIDALIFIVGFVFMLVILISIFIYFVFNNRLVRSSTLEETK